MLLCYVQLLRSCPLLLFYYYYYFWLTFLHGSGVMAVWANTKLVRYSSSVATVRHQLSCVVQTNICLGCSNNASFFFFPVRYKVSSLTAAGCGEMILLSCTFMKLFFPSRVGLRLTLLSRIYNRRKRVLSHLFLEIGRIPHLMCTSR